MKKEKIMQFTIKRRELANELALLNRTIEKKSTIPILTNVLIRARPDGTLKLTGTDLEIGITSILQTETLASAGAVTVPGKQLADALKKLPGDIVTFASDEAHQVMLTSGRITFKLSGMSMESYPELPAVPDDCFQIDAADLNEMIERTSFAISAEESRFTLNGALLHVNHTCKMVATDGHRLAFAEFPQLHAEGDSMSILIPKKAIVLIPLLSVESGKVVHLSTDADHVFFRAGDRILTARRLTGTFPDYERVMPKDLPHHAILDRKELKAMLQRARPFADVRSHAVKLTINPGEVSVQTSQLEAGAYNESLPASYDGPGQGIGVNADYLIAYLASGAEDEVDFGMTDHKTSMMFQPSTALRSGLRSLYVVMPMRFDTEAITRKSDGARPVESGGTPETEVEDAPLPAVTQPDTPVEAELGAADSSPSNTPASNIPASPATNWDARIEALEILRKPLMNFDLDHKTVQQCWEEVHVIDDQIADLQLARARAEKRNYTALMSAAADADAGRGIIHEHEGVINALERSIGLNPSVGTRGSGYGSRGFSTTTPKERKLIVKRALAINSAIGVELQSLIADGIDMEPVWTALLAKERDEPAVSRPAKIDREPVAQPPAVEPEPAAQPAISPAAKCGVGSPQKRDPRLPIANTVLAREFRGKHISVTVLDAGFSYDGQVFGSLSAIAKLVIGAKRNGFEFFGLLGQGHPSIPSLSADKD